MNCLPFNSKKVIYNGCIRWRNKYNQLHSFNDQPSLLYKNGTRYWFEHNKQHRGFNKPAVIWYNGNKGYWVNGKLVKRNRVK